MGPNSKDRLADALEANTEVQGHILTELRLIRASMAKVSARLAIETDDRIEADNQLGKVQGEHGRKLSLVGLGGGE